MPTANRQSEAVHEAKTVIAEAKDTVKSFFAAFGTVRSARNAVGAPTDEEQDLLRAALVFAGAGLDSTVKHLIRGAVPLLAISDDEMRSELETYVQRRLRDDAEQGSKYLANVMLSSNAPSKLIEDYVRHLTGESLQSGEQLLRILKAFGISRSEVNLDKNQLDRIFDARNKIIHELDISGSSGVGQRRRNSRRKVNIQSDAWRAHTTWRANNLCG